MIGIQLSMISATLSLLLALSPATAIEIPKNFLLTERGTRRPLSSIEKAEMGYDISDKLTDPFRYSRSIIRRVTDAGSTRSHGAGPGQRGPSR